MELLICNKKGDSTWGVKRKKEKSGMQRKWSEGTMPRAIAVDLSFDFVGYLVCSR